MSDPHQLAEIHATAFAGTAIRPWSATEFGELLMQTHVELLECRVRTEDDHHKLIGFALLQIILDEAELLTITVLPEFQSNGYGKNLLTNCLEFCSTKKTLRIFLEVAESSAAARALYEAAGFNTTHTRKNYYRNKYTAENAFLMEYTFRYKSEA